MKSELVKEVWKPVLGYEGLYEVSNFGRVKSLGHYTYHSEGCLKWKKEHILKTERTKNGRERVRLYEEGGKTLKHLQVHRLVWEAFNGTIPDGMQVNHIDERPWNNAVWNLNLMTPKENCNYGCRNTKISKKLFNNNHCKTVYEYTFPELDFVRTWPSTAECGRNGFDQHAVSDCCLGKRPQHKGSTFRYKTL